MPEKCRALTQSQSGPKLYTGCVMAVILGAMVL
jgi:hypothetical protein